MDPVGPSDHFLNQVRFRGLAASLAFLSEAQTNKVAERFNRLLREQSIPGSVFQKVEEVRHAVRAFGEVHNEHWHVEKLGLRSSFQMRRDWSQETA